MPTATQGLPVDFSLWENISSADDSAFIGNWNWNYCNHGLYITSYGMFYLHSTCFSV